MPRSRIESRRSSIRSCRSVGCFLYPVGMLEMYADAGSQNFHTKAALMICSSRAQLPQAYNKNGELRQNRWVSLAYLMSLSEGICFPWSSLS